MIGILAVNNLGFIGMNGELPWGKYSQDLQFFKKITLNKKCIVGYNTFQKLPKLPNRELIIDSRGSDMVDFDSETICIGGKSTYEKYCHLFTKLYISHIDDNTIGDTMMPNFMNLKKDCDVINMYFKLDSNTILNTNQLITDGLDILPIIATNPPSANISFNTYALNHDPYSFEGRISPKNVESLKENQVFVFGTNLSGFHGAGSAGFAFRGEAKNTWRQDTFFLKAIEDLKSNKKTKGKWAVFGVSNGYMEGNEGSSYGITTIVKPGMKRSYPLSDIRKHVNDFQKFVDQNMDKVYLVSELGCSFAGYSVEEIAPLFEWAKPYKNIKLPKRFLQTLGWI